MWQALAAAPLAVPPPLAAPPPPAAPPRLYRSRAAAQEPLIVVEGVTDAAAVRSARLRVSVVVTRGTPPKPGHARYTAPAGAVEALRTAARRAASAGAGVVVLADPDAGGRAMRAAVDALLRADGLDCAHAFMPARLCERAGAVGVQYAGPDAVREALAGARPRRANSGHCTLELLLALRLAGQHGEAPDRAAGVGSRRNALGAALGIGGCDGRTLLRHLNDFGYTAERLGAEMQAAGLELPAGIVDAAPPLADCG